MAARIANVVLGVWLFISAFIWAHTQAQMTNTWIVGALCAIFALAAMRAPQARYVNTALAIWLFISVWVLPTMSAATLWNNVLVAIAVFIVDQDAHPAQSQIVENFGDRGETGTAAQLALAPLHDLIPVLGGEHQRSLRMV